MDINEDDVRSFFARFSFRIRQEAPTLRVRELIEARSAILQDPEQRRNSQASAFSIVSVGADGELSTFSPELLCLNADHYNNFVFGNVHGGGVAAMTHNRHFLTAEREIDSGLEACRRYCDYFDVCLGGAPANKWCENGTFASTETTYCRFSKKAIIDVVLSELERELAATH
jgi:uncharacterized protein